MSSNHTEMLNALRAGLGSGAALARRRFLEEAHTVRRKEDGSPVTAVDVEVEKAIMSELVDSVAGIPLLGEESAAKAPDRLDTYVAIDPIDGTSNFMRGVPFFGMTAVYVEDGQAQAGVVLDPAHEREYWATRGGGAYLNGEPLRPSARQTKLSRATVASAPDSLPTGLQREFLPELARRVHRLQAIRSVALEICGLAAGWIDAALFNGVAVWDFGAAALIVEEAGGRWTELDGSRPDLARVGARYSFFGTIDSGLYDEITALMRSGSA